MLSPVGNTPLFNFYPSGLEPPNSVQKDVVYTPEGLDPSEEANTQSLLGAWAERELISIDNSSTKTQEFFLKVTTFSASIAASTTTMQFVTATMQFLSSIASKQIVDWFSKRVPAANEGPSSLMEKLLAFTRNVRGNYSELLDTPIYKFFIDVVGMAAVCGHVPTITVGDCPVITAEWAKSCAASVMLDFPSVILRSIEFTLEVVTTISRGGSLSTFVSGRGVLTLVARVLAREQDVKSSMLEVKHKISVDQHLCDASVALVQIKELLKHASGTTFTIASAQRAKLEQHIATVESFVKISGFRARPFCILLAGPSGVGKSTCLNEIYRKVGKVNNFATEPENIAEITETDKYDSTITGLTTVIQQDDMGQIKDCSNLPETPHAKMIRFNNTAPSMAIKPDTADKGCIPLRPKLIAITSNTAHLQAATYMKAPEALLISRINAAVWMTPKEYCCDENGRIIGSNVRPGESPHWVQPITYTVNNGRVTMKFGDKIDFDSWLPGVLKQSIAHREEQELLRIKFEQQKNFDLCMECCYDMSKCKCAKTYETEALFNFFQTPRQRSINRAQPYLSALSYSSVLGFRDIFRSKTEKAFADFVTFWYWRIASLFKSAILFLITSCMLALLSILLLYGSFAATLYLAALLYVVHLISCRSRAIIADAIVEEMTMIQTDFGNSLGAAFLGSFVDHVVIAAAFLPLLGVIRMLVQSLGYTNEGNITVTNKCTIRERRAEVNEWLTSPKVIPIVASEKARTTSQTAAETKIMQRVCEIQAPTARATGKALCYGVNVYADWVVIPKHSFKLMDTTAEWQFVFDTQEFGPNRKSCIDINTVTEVQQDHVAFRVFKLNKNGDIRSFFPRERFQQGQMSSAKILRKKNGTIHSMRVATEYKERLQTEAAIINGVRGTVPELTEVGDCGSPWIKEGVPRVILGLHNGRHNREAIAEVLYQQDFDFMTQVMEYNLEGRTAVNLPVAPLVEVVTNTYGEEILTSTDLTPSSCMNYCTANDGALPLVEVYGSCRGLSFSNSKSKVCRSPLSNALELCGNSCQWGAPPLCVKRNHEMVFEIAQHPIDSINGTTMRWAKDDYLLPVLKLIHDIEYRSSPLTDNEIYNGRKSESINPMNMKTSPGIGLSGKKADHCEVVETQQGNVYTPKPYVKDEVERLRNLAISGKRSCPISKTALKDEPTKLSKDAARIFYVMPMAFIAICRQVMCPVLAFMMATPLMTESWFGVRVTTDEWGQCHTFLDKFSNGNTMNGDYSKYDLHFSSQLIFTVGEIFASIGRALGFPPWAVSMLASIFSDLANPVYAYAGSLVSFLGLMPSGNPATVAINGIGNSLLHRCFFFEGWIKAYGQAPRVGAFRQYCAMGFVGDDSIGGVSSEIPWFNMQNFQSWLAVKGMPYTPADKNAAMPLYVPLRDASLCKRKFVHMVDGVVDAPIELASIFKSMHMMHKAQEDERMITSLNVTQGLRELARWPENVFNQHHETIQQACNLANLPVTGLDRSYASWRKEIEDTYHGIVSSDSVEDEELFRDKDILFDRSIYTIVE